jgi:hypothetical protein
MENIHLNSPYKIIPSKHKRYSGHYEIPGADCIVIPRKKYGDQILADVLWKDAAGDIQHKADLMFDSINLDVLNPMKDFILFEVWEGSNNKEVNI